MTAIDPLSARHASGAMDAAPRFFQLGFVCGDLDAAIATMGKGNAFLVLDVAALGGDAGSPIRRIGLGYLGDINIELIEVKAEIESIYRAALPKDGGTGFHHIGYLVDDENWPRLCETMARHGGAALAGDAEGFLSYAYVDRRADLGHFVEYVKLGEGGRALFAGAPRGWLALPDLQGE